MAVTRNMKGMGLMRMRSLGHNSRIGDRSCRCRPLVRSRGRLARQAATHGVAGRRPLGIRRSTNGGERIWHLTQVRRLPLRKLAGSLLRQLPRRASGHLCFRKLPVVLLRCSFLCLRMWCCVFVLRSYGVICPSRACACSRSLLSRPSHRSLLPQRLRLLFRWFRNCLAVSSVFAVVSSVCVLFFVCFSSRLPRLLSSRRLSRSRSGGR